MEAAARGTMTRIQPITFPSEGQHRVQLEGIFHLVGGPGQWPAAVICHPHPLGGGTMHNNVVKGIAQALADRGVLALRFNFRGVEKSGGRYDRGRAEQEDVAGAVRWLMRQPEVDSWHVSVVGYSFGAWVGLTYAQADPRIAAIAGVGLVPWSYDLDVAQSDLMRQTRHFDPGFLASFTRPKLFVSGEDDQFNSPESLRELLDRIPPPKSLHILSGTDHFFIGREKEVGSLIADFIPSP
jgi:alpha/beta superfamily hydrolase